MEIKVAKTAGYCFGVNKAVDIVYNLLDKCDKKIYTLGPIIHNDNLVNDLKSRGVSVIADVSDAIEEGYVVIRTHGVIPDVYRDLVGKNQIVIDATCPYVKKIHNLVKQMYEEGFQIVIAGDKLHPEVIGINGYCDNTAIIVNAPEDLDLVEKIEKDCCIFAQTTLTQENWKKINNKLKQKCKNVKKFDTICNATVRRQNEAELLAKSCDVMLVIGSKKSSNTQKLFEICNKYCDATYYIETHGDMPPMNIKKIKTLGITAGASTPGAIIEEVIREMDELNRQENEISFKEAFESSLVTLQSGEVVKGKIIGFNNAEIYVDLGYKSDGIITVDEYSDDPDFKPESNIKVGDEIEVFIIRVNDGDGIVQLSKKKVESMKSMTYIDEAYENKTTLPAKVIEVTNGGLIAIYKGVRIFIPASLVAEKFVKNLDEFLKQTINVRIIELNKQKRKIVGSAKVILSENRQATGGKIWDEIEAGKKYTGTVKNLMDFGAFVDIGGVDGLLHVSEMSWTKIKHPSDVLKVGDQIEVEIKEIDKEKRRISLGYKKEQDNPWTKVAEKYKVGDIIKGKVARLVPFGAFIELDEGIDGLVHISQISNSRIAKPGDVLTIGQEVEVKVIEVNIESKKISLSIKELDANQIVAEVNDTNQSAAEEIIADPDSE